MRLGCRAYSRGAAAELRGIHASDHARAVGRRRRIGKSRITRGRGGGDHERICADHSGRKRTGGASWLTFSSFSDQYSLTTKKRIRRSKRRIKRHRRAGKAWARPSPRSRRVRLQWRRRSSPPHQRSVRGSTKWHRPPPRRRIKSIRARNKSDFPRKHIKSGIMCSRKTGRASTIWRHIRRD